MAEINLSAIEYFLPLASFLLVFVVVFAALAKSKILGEGKFVQLFVSFIVAIIFVSATGAREFVLNATPWVGVLVVLLLAILILVGLSGKVDFMTKGLGVVFVVALIILFIISAFNVFASTSGGNILFDWIKAPRVYGALILLVIAAIVSWVLIKIK